MPTGLIIRCFFGFAFGYLSALYFVKNPLDKEKQLNIHYEQNNQ